MSGVPAYVMETLRTVAALRSTTPEALGELVDANATRAFCLA